MHVILMEAQEKNRTHTACRAIADHGGIITEPPLCHQVLSGALGAAELRPTPTLSMEDQGVRSTSLLWGRCRLEGNAESSGARGCLAKPGVQRLLTSFCEMFPGAGRSLRQSSGRSYGAVWWLVLQKDLP